MFRKNDDHKQLELFNSFLSFKPTVAKMLNRTWAPVFYEQVFCKINEDLFAPMYCLDNGRPNFAINRLLSLEIIKNLFDYTDIEILDQFHFNYQVMYALGIRNFGEVSLAERTIYDFRERVFNYIKEHPDEDNILFQQFEILTKNFINIAGIKLDQQRLDSTLISPNIKKAGRLSLAHDVLAQAVQSIPENLLSENLKPVLNSSFKNNLLYHTRNREIDNRFQTVLDLMFEVETLGQQHPDLDRLEPLNLLKRFLKEQAVFNQEEQRYLPRSKKDVSASSLQSAYDSDATFRDKAGKKHSGYVLQLSETCSEENPVQLITDYDLKPNHISDVELSLQRLEAIKKNTDAQDLYVDGGFYSPDVIKEADRLNIEMHYTDMTGKKPLEGKIPLSKFTINDQMDIIYCPAGFKAERSHYNDKKKTLSIHFSKDHCQACPFRPDCPVKTQKKDFILRTSQKALLAATVREQVNDKQIKRENISMRAGIEGTNSALKRSQGANHLKVRGLTKCEITIALMVVGHNFKQFLRNLMGRVRPKFKKRNKGQLCPLSG